MQTRCGRDRIGKNERITFPGSQPHLPKASANLPPTMIQTTAMNPLLVQDKTQTSSDCTSDWFRLSPTAAHKTLSSHVPATTGIPPGTVRVSRSLCWLGERASSRHQLHSNCISLNITWRIEDVLRREGTL